MAINTTNIITLVIIWPVLPNESEDSPVDETLNLNSVDCGESEVLKSSLMDENPGSIAETLIRTSTHSPT